MHECTYLHMHVSMDVCTYVCMCTCMYMYDVYLHVCMYVLMHDLYDLVCVYMLSNASVPKLIAQFWHACKQPFCHECSYMYTYMCIFVCLICMVCMINTYGCMCACTHVKFVLFCVRF
jgi:hypothetical protein